MKLTILVGLAWMLVATDSVHAHGGRLNANGCHSDRKAQTIHCHLQQHTGIPKVTDGDTIRIGKARIRLHGIDAPEAKQTCTAGGKEWRCGFEATNALANIIGENWITCVRKDTDRYGRIVAVCRVGEIDLNAWMVGNGWALAYRRFSLDYVADEIKAMREKRGIWRGQFSPPWEWRRKKR